MRGEATTFTMESGGEDPMTQVANRRADLCYSTTHSAVSTLFDNLPITRIRSSEQYTRGPRRELVSSLLLLPP